MYHIVEKIKANIVTCLLWSQKYTKTDMLYLAKGGFWVGFAQTCNSIFSLILVIAFANLLPKETYGTYRYILSIAGMLNIFTLSGMNNAVSRAVAKGDEGVLRPAVMYQLKWNLLMFGASAFLAGYYFIHDDTILATSLLILGVFVPATLAFNTYGSYLDGKKQFRIAYSFSVLSTFVYSLGMFLTLLVTENVIWIVAVYAITTFIPSFIFYTYVIRTFKPPVAIDTADTLKYGRELTFLRFTDPLVSQIDKVVLAHFWGPAQLAIYSLALAVPNRATLFMKSWIAIGFPKFAEKSFKEINQVFWRRILQGMVVGIGVTLVYFFLSPHLFKYVLPQYLESIYYSQLLSLNFILAIPNRYISLLFTSQRLSYVLLKRTLIQGIITILLYVTLGMWRGLLGLVIANLCITVIGFLINLSLWLKTSKMLAHDSERITNK